MDEVYPHRNKSHKIALVQMVPLQFIIFSTKSLLALYIAYYTAILFGMQILCSLEFLSAWAVYAALSTSYILVGVTRTRALVSACVYSILDAILIYAGYRLFQGSEKESDSEVAIQKCNFWFNTTSIIMTLHSIINLVNIGYNMEAEIFWIIVKPIFLVYSIIHVRRYINELSSVPRHHGGRVEQAPKRISETPEVTVVDEKTQTHRKSYEKENKKRSHGSKS